MRVAIVGSREFPDLDQVRSVVGSLPDDTIVISGGARGVDQAAAEAARDRGLQVVEHHADWRAGKHAGFVRNKLIVADCDQLIAFWYKHSNGTKDTIREALRRNKLLAIYDGEGRFIPVQQQLL